jgi:hypothetical protein
MGQEILYCFKCQERVTSAELEASKGLRFGVRTACRKCVPDLLATLSEKERNELAARAQAAPVPDPRTSTGKYVLSTATPRTRSLAVASAKAAPGSNGVWVVVGVVVLIVIAAALLLVNSGGPPPARENPPPLPPPKPPSESARDRSAREVLERARSLPAADLEAQVSAYAEAARLAEGTSYEREAKERHEGVLEMRRKAYARELAAMEERAKALMNKEEFGPSLALFDSARTLHSGPEWKGQVEAMVDLYRKRAEASYADLKAKAGLARERGAEDELRALRERMSRWGLPQLAKDLEAHLAALPPPADIRPWTPVFDGKSLDFLVDNGEGSWVVENGVLVRVKDRKPSAQTRRQFGDGEFRVRFEGRQVQFAGFAFRQGLAFYGIGWDRTTWSQLGDREHELLVVARGDEVVATLDGKPQKVDKNGAPSLQGPVQFNAIGESFVVKSLEFRELGLDDGLVGYWTFDSISGTTAPDSSPLKNDGLLVGDPVVVPGRIGSALQFDGRRSHVAVPSHPSLVLTGPFTICAWVKPTGSERRNVAIAEKWDDAPAGSKGLIRGYMLRLTGNRPHLVVSEADGSGEVSSPKPIPPDEWTFVAGVFDGTAQAIYVNGVLERKVASTKGSQPSTNSFRIGMSGGGGGQHFLGAIDDVRVYSRALSPQDIAKLARGR